MTLKFQLGPDSFNSFSMSVPNVHSSVSQSL